MTKPPLAYLFALGLAGAGVSAQTVPEVQVTTTDILSPRFDSKAARLAYVNASGELWLATVDKATGSLLPADGRGQLLDAETASVMDFGYGAEWAYSTKGAQIVYTKYAHGAKKSAKTASSAVATEAADGSWSTAFITGADKTHSPVGTANTDEKFIYVNYQGTTGKSFYWQLLNGIDSTPHLVPNSETADNSRQWILGTHSILYTAAAAMPDGTTTQQVYQFNADDNTVKQLTFDRGSKFGGVMWKDPALKEKVFFTMVDRKTLNVYRKASSGAWTISKTITMPAKLPYVWGAQVLIYKGASYLTMQVSSSAATNDMTVPTHLAISGIDPEKSDFRMLTNDSSAKRVRITPQVFVTNAGPQIYYSRLKPASGATAAQSEGMWRVDTGLGAPK
jgi:hypothetical protein